jgi:hypothetical protein
MFKKTDLLLLKKDPKEQSFGPGSLTKIILPHPNFPVTLTATEPGTSTDLESTTISLHLLASNFGSEVKNRKSSYHNDLFL